MRFLKREKAIDQAENFVKEELKCIAGNIDITVANTGFNSMIKKLFEFIGGDLG